VTVELVSTPTPTVAASTTPAVSAIVPKVRRHQGRSDGGGYIDIYTPPKYLTNFYVVTGCFFSL